MYESLLITETCPCVLSPNVCLAVKIQAVNPNHKKSYVGVVKAHT